VLQDIQPLEISYLCVEGLRLYLANPLATFKTIQQARAVEVLSRGNPHVLIVMPTSAGKSAIYMSPGYVENAGFRLVVLPYRSLLDQVVQDAKSKGLPYSTFPSPDIDLFHSHLIFVSLEHCADIEFRTWIEAVKASNLLRAIVTDEAHDVLIASDYRHAFKMLLKITDLAVQVALLTGTLSPRSEVALLQVSIAP
jgi:superfamily II DNA helicase RecQ